MSNNFFYNTLTELHKIDSKPPQITLNFKNMVDKVARLHHTDPELFDLLGIALTRIKELEAELATLKESKPELSKE